MKVLACILLCSAALYNVGGVWMRVEADEPGYRAIDEYLLRFEECRSLLPRRGRVSYIGETIEGDGGELQTTANHLLAQYALAPLVVERGTVHDLVVANFTTSEAAAGRLPGEFTIVRDFGNGVLLLRRTTP
jgi:hypothetical protein